MPCARTLARARPAGRGRPSCRRCAARPVAHASVAAPPPVAPPTRRRASGRRRHPSTRQRDRPQTGGPGHEVGPGPAGEHGGTGRVVPFFLFPHRTGRRLEQHSPHPDPPSRPSRSPSQPFPSRALSARQSPTAAPPPSSPYTPTPAPCRSSPSLPTCAGPCSPCWGGGRTRPTTTSEWCFGFGLFCLFVLLGFVCCISLPTCPSHSLFSLSLSLPLSLYPPPPPPFPGPTSSHP